MTEVQVRLFGAFRNLGLTEVALTLPGESVTVGEMKSLLATHFSTTQGAGATSASFNAIALVEKSALASDSEVLDDQDRVMAGSRLALLPPVSGG